MRRRMSAVLALAGLALTWMVTAAPADAGTGFGTAAPGAVTADDGAYVAAQQWLDTRTLDLTVHSPAMAADEHVRLLVPPDWNSRPNEPWPVLYLLHGCCDSYVSWTRSTDVEQLTGTTDVLVVMPEAGADGFYSDWWNEGAGGSPQWETFHLTELRQILERGFRASPRRAVAGLSMGGYGAMKYAETGLFRAAASFSGVLDPLSNPGGVLASLYPNALWGEPVAQRPIWVANDPTDHVDRLHGVKLFVAAGDGRPGRYDDPSRPADAVEAEVHAESVNFVDALRQAHVPVTTDFYGPGTHAWPYWQQDLHQAFPMLMRAIGARNAVGLS
ncbi:alpha/beta hydrolase [Actinacidiphila acidipaludis]|uniref:Esterase family protein n=1 Tax=Actinacidiphila acidipaludis TaxID=2873382 RepID=A0ABS7QAR5_9ACTN|nr:alpha/beta hydrolase family protein [Streptomyces acidipaludis]MBY8880267.1 esterase family protein [Streptomyces acidipaludis]